MLDARQILDHYGLDKQGHKTIQELNELAVALSHYLEGRCSPLDVITELADVSIMVEQMCCHFGLGEVLAEKTRKLERVSLRVKNGDDKSRKASKKISFRS